MTANITSKCISYFFKQNTVKPCLSKLLQSDIFLIFKFILLTPRKATEALYIRQEIMPTCFRRCQDIAVRLKFFILFYRDMTEI